MILLALVVLRFVPDWRSRVKEPPRSNPAEARLVLAGLDCAPMLIPRLASAYRELYPKTSIEVLHGGTRQALEDLLNGRADVAFLNRDLTMEERAVVHEAGESTLVFPIALGGIALLAATSPGVPESVPVQTLRSLLEGEEPKELEAPQHLYVPDPNQGLWDALLSQLGLSSAASGRVVFLAGEQEVIEAVSRDPHGLGIASTLELPPDLARSGVQAIRIRPDGQGAGPDAARPTETAIATGEYPLFHYLYVSCTPKSTASASGFVTFLHSGRGQRLVASEGFLPARDVPHEVVLTSKPLQTAG
ncbi:MAG: substrate-binding domain-containing protein [Candidatus Eisenbacteria bacterium]|nr:substrate-binding domain-containing protein [Candidatus Eisenbacteria bacterium]